LRVLPPARKCTLPIHWDEPRPKTVGDVINELEQTLLLVELGAHITLNIDEEEGLALFEAHIKEVADALQASKNLWVTTKADWYKYVAAIQADN